MPLYNHTAFLCGCFSYDTSVDFVNTLSSLGWHTVEASQEEIAIYRQYFYPGFVDFSLGGGTGFKVSRMCLSGPWKIMVAATEVEIKDIVIYLMPYGMALYSIQTQQEAENLGAFTYPLFLMREVRRWSEPVLADFCHTVIKPLEEASRRLGYQGETLIENGNKLKVFQIVSTDRKENFSTDTDTLLFEFGTLGKIGGCDNNDPDSPSQSYIDNVLSGHTLSYFNNWRGLALFDTFTLIGYSVKPWVLDTWKNDYFGLIYIHSLFCKFYLFSLAARFRSDPEQSEALEREYHEFERLYTFHRISYNFLPGEIDRAIDKALEISEEKELIAKYISDYNRLREEESGKRLNRILTFLAIVTVFSTVWDIACMIDAMWPFEAFNMKLEYIFRIVVSLTLLTVILAIISMLRKPTKH